MVSCSKEFWFLMNQQSTGLFFLINFDCLHTTHIDESIIFSYLVFVTLSFLHSVFILRFTKYDKIVI